MIMTLIWFMIILTLIVVAHELGHYLFARMFNTKVEEFAVGFGPKLFNIKGKNTTFRFNSIPLGGYVRLAGEDIESPEYDENDKTLYLNKKPWQKFLISFAGPLFSFLLGLIIIIIIGIGYGFPKVGIAQVQENSPAYISGLQENDTILKINGDYIFDPSILAIELRNNKPINLTVDRNGLLKDLKVSPVLSEKQSLIYLYDYEIKESNKIENDLKINDSANFYNILNKMEKNDLTKISYKNSIYSGFISNYMINDQKPVIGITFNLFSNKIMKDVDIFQKNDLIVGINEKNINNGTQLISTIQTLNIPENTILITTYGNQIQEINRSSKNDLLLKISRNNEIIELNMTKEELFNYLSIPGFIDNSERLHPTLSQIIPMSFSWAKSLIESVIQVFSQLFTGQTSTDELSGPVGIVNIVGQASKAGLESILNLIALITINLGVFNLLPLPALDGGRIVFSLYEIITRKRVNPKIEGIIHFIGFILLMGFAIYVTFNDISRIIK